MVHDMHLRARSATVQGGASDDLYCNRFGNTAASADGRQHGAAHRRSRQAYRQSRRRGADAFKEQLPDLESASGPRPGSVADIEYLAFMRPDFDALPAFPEPEGDVQPLGRRRGVHRSSESAEGAARQDRAAGRRSDDDGICRHARAALSSRHARLSGGAGAQGVAPACRSSGPRTGASASSAMA